MMTDLKQHKNMKKILLLFVVFLLPLLASAYDFKSGGIYYNIVDNNTVSVTYGKSQYSSYSGDIVIPRQVTYNGKTYYVRQIGNHSFFYCDYLTSVTIPNTVTYINDAFVECYRMEAVNISDIEAWCKILFDGYYKDTNPLYSAHHLYLNGEEIKDLVIPNGIITINDQAFCGCSGLNSVTIPNNVTSIGIGAFYGCSGLTSVEFHCNTIGSWFKNYTSIKNIIIGNEVTSIDSDAFSGCSGLTSVEFHCNTIGSWFSNNTTIKNIIIGNEVTSIGTDAFSGCTGLTSVTIPNSVTKIDIWAFYKCSSLSSITIPNSVTSIGHGAFASCSSLTSITIPNSVTSIGAHAFSDTGWYNNQPDGLVYAGKVAYKYKGTMTDNTTIFKDGTLGIAGQAFFDCRNLTSITIPSSVVSIGKETFKSTNLTSIVVESGNQHYDSRNNCNAIIETSSNTLVYGCKNTFIPNSVTCIGFGAFSYCSDLTSITIPNSVTSISNYAFWNCSSLTSITIPNSVTSLGGQQTFDGCKSLISVTLSNSLNDIPAWGFRGCTSLTSICIPSSVTTVRINAFENCSSLKYICISSDKFPTFKTIDNTTCQYIMPQKAFESGIPQEITNYATYSDKPMYIQVKSKTATSAVLEICPVDNPYATYTITKLGLIPSQNLRWELDEKNYGIISEKTDGTLTIETQPAQAMSTTKAKLSATVNEPNDDKHYGFEWRRIGVDDLVPSNVVYSQLYDGQIVGTLNNLNPDISYKYRPFYKSDSGDMFYGEWIGFLTGDANVFFEPEVHTKEPVALTKDGAQLSGVWVEGTEDIQEKGFEYWPKNSGARPITRGTHVTAVIVKGNETSVTLEGLDPGTEYVYRSYMRTASGTVYGEEMTFKTPLMGDANDDGKVNVADIVEINNAKAGNPSASFNMTNADTDGNGTLTEADITAIGNIIMQK